MKDDKFNELDRKILSEDFGWNYGRIRHESTNSKKSTSSPRSPPRRKSSRTQEKAQEETPKKK